MDRTTMEEKAKAHAEKVTPKCRLGNCYCGCMKEHEIARESYITGYADSEQRVKDLEQRCEGLVKVIKVYKEYLDETVSEPSCDACKHNDSNAVLLDSRLEALKLYEGKENEQPKI